MIGFLRFVGMLNAAAWLGAALFYVASVAPAVSSSDMRALLGAKHFDYISGALAQIVLARYFYWHTVCAFIALLHLLAEWLYLGRTPHRLWLGLLAGLLWLSLLGSFWFSPKLTKLHRAQHYLNLKPADREAAVRSFRYWRGVFQAVNVLMIGGVAVYFWRATHPSDSLRFVTPVKFRS